MPTYVIGHKNPDTDAICSAIGYANFLSRTGRVDAEPARCGEINIRTQYVLEQCGLPSPKLILDVRPTTSHILRRSVISARCDESLMDAFDRMRANGLRSLPVMDHDDKMVGMVSLTKTLEILLPAQRDGLGTREVFTNLQRLCQVLGGHFAHALNEKNEQSLIMTVGAMRADAFSSRLEEYPADRVLLVVGNRPTVQKPAIEYGVRCIVVTGGYELDPDLLQQAKERNVSVIISPHDTATTTLLIKCSQRVSDVVLSDYVHFHENVPLERIRDEVAHSNMALFPVLDDESKLLGVFSKSDLINPPLTRLVLVDHNEFTQAVNGVEEADILEVIDHHRLGGHLVTREPIRFINDPLGSTSTIVARMFKQQNIEPTPEIALCLAAGIISDTLFLTSPTTTPQDKETLEWLGSLTSKNLKDFSDAFFAAGSPLKILSSEEVVRLDCKDYEENGWKFAAAQVEELGLDRFWERKEELGYALEAMRKERGLDFACFLITDITLHYSLMLVRGEQKVIDTIDYPQMSPDLYELAGIVSRKKQLLPVLIRLMNQVPR